MKTYGTITWFKGSWIIEAEPHVVIRLRRVFPRVARKRDFLGIADTVEISRELEWFCSRFPLQYKDSPEMQAAQVEGRLADRARLHRDGESIVDKMLKGIQPATNFRLALPARDYQKLAASLVLQTGGLLIADDMGLGKTCTAICVLTDPRARPALVCTLTALPSQWESEVRKFAPNLVTHVLKGTRPYDLVKACGGKFPDVILTSYSKLAGWAETLAPTLNSVTWDECLSADTQVSLWPNGRRTLVDLGVGDRIASFGTSGLLEEDRVVGIAPKGARQIWRLTLRDGRFLDCTDNEKVMTAAGWRYVSEIINEASACNEGIATDATDGHSAPAHSWDDAGRRMPRLEPDASAIDVHSWPETGSLREAQGGGAEELRADATEVGSERRVRRDFMYIPHGNNPGLRILAVPLLPKRRRAVSKDCHAGVASFARLGGLRVLVHGRWAPEPRNGWNKHPLLPKGRSGVAGAVVSPARAVAGDRQSQGKEREGIFHPAVLGEGHAGHFRSDPPIRSGVHGIQGFADNHQERTLYSLSLGHRNQDPGLTEDGRLRISRVPARSTATLAPKTPRETIGANLPRLRRSTWASDTALQTMPSSGAKDFEEHEVSGGAPFARAGQMRLVRKRVPKAKRAFGISSYVRRAGLSDSPETVVEEQDLRLAPHRLLSIERRGIQEVWDVETEKNHTLVANGFGVHNCQELRRGDTTHKGAAAALIARKVKFRTSLSGTPVYNMGGELHPVMEVTRPGALGTKTEFSLEWCTGDAENPGKLKIKDPKAMGTYLRDSGLMIRRTKEDVGREIPKLTRVPHIIDCDMKELNKIEGKAVALAQIIMSKNQQARGQQMQAASELNNLVRQATGVSKSPFCAEFIRMLAASEERILVYLWHRECYEILMEALSDEKLGNLHPVMYSGSESVKQKQEAKDRFCGGDSRVMLMSLRSGAGLDGLQHHCRVGVFAELDWSPGVHEQGEARIARDGQPFPTLFYYLLSNGGSDPIISDMLGIKRGQIEGIRDPKGALEHGLDADGQNVRKLAQAYLLKRAQVTPNGFRVVK